MPKRSLSGGSLDPPKYSKISGLLQRLDSVDGMGPFGPISASEAARAILGGSRGGAKCQKSNITADVCSKLPRERSQSQYYCRRMRKEFARLAKKDPQINSPAGTPTLIPKVPFSL